MEIRTRYQHRRCNSISTLTDVMATQIAQRPDAYYALVCGVCGEKFPCTEFFWVGTDPELTVGEEETYIKIAKPNIKHPSSKHYLMQFFVYDHLRDESMKQASKFFCALAERVVSMDYEQLTQELPAELVAAADRWKVEIGAAHRNPESAFAWHKLRRAAISCDGDSVDVIWNRVLRLLLEAKDCAVRAVLFKGA